MLLIPIVVLFLLTVLAFWMFQHNKENYNYALFLFGCFVFALEVTLLGLFLITLYINSGQYYQAIDPINTGYAPFSFDHIISLAVFYGLGLISALFIWLKGRSLPPLTFVVASSLMLIGVVINVAILFHMDSDNDESYLYAPASILYLFIAFSLMINMILDQSIASRQIIYSNSFLNNINNKMSDISMQPFWIVVMMFPMFIIITMILILFGQHPDSMIKVFTETATWNFSQKAHPLFLDEHGHYLCTVAASGSPSLVKPLAIGVRHGQPIIINRQLQVANAFEEMIKDLSPIFHSWIRGIYDKYGYPISKHITSKSGSDITYILMKPLEWFFLICLYLGCKFPEEKIRKQYMVFMK